MKHEPNIIAILVTIFVLAQVIGLAITDRYLDYDITSKTGEAEFKDLPFDTPRPDVEQSTSFLWIMMAVILGTVLVMTIIKFRKMHLWKLWFFLSVVITLTFALAAFIPDWVALGLALLLGIWKIYRPNFWIQNSTEIFIYGGLAALFVPIIDIFSSFMLLLLISLYDMYAVWKSEHMITMAKTQTEQKLFAGLMVPYKKGAKLHAEKPTSGKVVKVRNAILGGGDIGFPLIFTGVIMKTLLMNGIPRLFAYLETAVIVICVTSALALLLQYGKKDKFYPAMPYLTAGLLVGYVIVFLLNRIVVV